MKFHKLFLVLSIVLANLLLLSTPAEARPPRAPSIGITIEVVETMDSSWDVQRALYDIDWYAGSNWKLVKKCSRAYYCLHVRPGKVSGAPVGWAHSCRRSTQVCRITIDTAKAKKMGKYNYDTKRWLIRHEFGHYLGLGHAKSCNTTMYEYVRCPKKSTPPPYAFTSSEQTFLKRW